MTRIFIYFLIFNSFFIYTLCEVVNFSDCTDSDPKGACTIHALRINPCKEASSNKACKLKKGSTYELQMDFTSLQPIETMKSLPYWASVADLPFAGMDNDACKFTACPIAQGVNQTYDFQLNIAKSLPRGTFDVKWKFWIDEDKKVGCCSRFNLKLVA